MANEWTTEYPTQPGYYWLRNCLWQVYGQWGTPDPELCVVHVTPGLHFFDIGSELMYDKSDIVSAEWCGPIQPPRENEK